MNEANDKTIEAYERGVKMYNAVGIPDVVGSVKTWINASLSMLPSRAKILELGSARGL
jgi:hypothetical protein